MAGIRPGKRPAFREAITTKPPKAPGIQDSSSGGTHASSKRDPLRRRGPGRRDPRQRPAGLRCRRLPAVRPLHPREPGDLPDPRPGAGGPGAAQPGRGAKRRPGPGPRDRRRQRAGHREPGQGGDLRPGRRHREGRPAGPGPDRQPDPAAGLGSGRHRLLLRRAGPLERARPGEGHRVRERGLRLALPRGQAGDEGAAQGPRRGGGEPVRRHGRTAAGRLEERRRDPGEADRQPGRLSGRRAFALQPAARPGKRRAWRRPAETMSKP